MSYDLAIWKRSATTKTAMLAQAYRALSEGRDHPAMQRLDLSELARALKDEFGDYDTAQCVIACATGQTQRADWLTIQCSFSDADSVVSRLVPLVLDLGLMLYDPQREVVWGNRRNQL